MKKPHFYVQTSLAVALFAIMHPVFADDTTLPTIKVAAEKKNDKDAEFAITTQSLKSEESLFKTAKSISVVTEKQIEQKQATSLNDAIQGVAGVISAPLGRRGSDDFIIRGQDSSNAIYVDGLRQTQASDASNDITGLARIEVVKGPDSMHFGQTAPGGIVNLVTKRPVNDNFNEVNLRYGSHNLRQVGFDVNHTVVDSEKAAWRLNATYSDQDDATDSVYFKNFYISPSYNFDLGEKTDLSVIASYSHKEYVRQQGLPLYGSIFSNVNGSINRHLFTGDNTVKPYQSETYHLGYNFKHTFDNDWTFQQNFGAQKSHLNGQTVFINSTSATSATITRSGRDQHYQDQNFSIDNNFAKVIEFAGMQHHVMIGADAMHDTRDVWNYTCSIGSLNLYTPVYGQTFCATKILRKADSVEATLKTLGVYVKDQIDVTDHLNLNLGLRHDWAQVKAVSNAVDSRDNQSNHAFTGSVSALYNINEMIAPYVSYSTSFIPTTDVNSTTGTIALFDPEKAKQFEVGFKLQSPNQRVQGSLVWFDLTRFNVISADSNGDKYQTGEENTQGFETEVAAKVTPNWLVSSNYTYTPTAKVTSDETASRIGKRLKNVSKQAFNLSTRYNFNQGTLDGWFIGAGVRSESAKTAYLNNTTMAQNYRIAGYGLFDAQVGYQAKNWQASLDVKNILNKEYYAGGNTLFVALGDDRQVNFNLSYKF